MTMNINLTPQLEELVRKKVSSGRYNSASEVIREALRLMEAQDQLQAVRLGQLRQDIRQDRERATTWNAEQTNAEATKRGPRKRHTPRQRLGRASSRRAALPHPFAFVRRGGQGALRPG